MQRAISEDISAPLPMTPDQWRAEVLIKSILGAGRVHHTQIPLPTPVSQHSEETDGEVCCSRMRHWLHNKCQVGQ